MTRGPSVLYLIDSLAAGGSERSLVDLAPHLLARGVRLDIAVLDGRRGLEESLLRAGVSVHILRGRGRAGRVASALGLIRRTQPDLVHTTLYESDQAGRIAARIAGTPVVSSLVTVSYGPEHRSEPGVRLHRLRAAHFVDCVTARLVTRFHAVSQTVAEVMTSRLHLPPARVEVIPRGRDAQSLGRRTSLRRARARAALGVAKGTPLLLAVARHEPQKGLETLLRALPLVRRDHPSAVVAVAGSQGRMTDQLESLIVDLGLVSCVSLLDPRDGVPDLLCAADVFVLPSRREGLPGAVIEAMALEVPIVASNLPSVRELVPGEEFALLVPPGDPCWLADAILDSLGSSGPVATRTVRARERFLAHFEIGPVADRMERFYRSVLNSEQMGPRATEPTD